MMNEPIDFVKNTLVCDNRILGLDDDVDDGRNLILSVMALQFLHWQANICRS